ncbi:MAG: nitrilase-related carbon-nitrogen hydrolase [Candidatus Hydrogenedentales bacterium]
MSRVGFAQFEVIFGEPDRNRATMAGMIARAADADLLVFPELAVSGYDFVDAGEAELFSESFGDGPTSVAASNWAQEYSTTIVVGYADRAAEGLYNSCILALPDGALHNYRKIHLFSREKLFFLPGDAPPPVIETPAGRIGLMICFDWIFPETARTLALAGAQIIAHPSNLVLPWCQRAMFARCVENRVFAVTANRIGTEDRAGRTLTFTGASQVLDPAGDLLEQAPADKEAVNTVEIDPARADDKALNEHNHLFNDRRPELYGENPAHV